MTLKREGRKLVLILLQLHGPERGRSSGRDLSLCRVGGVIRVYIKY